jgi:CRISPR/Cas system CSM-associated protein Csm3 (group 7 of RAMP superfamily)
MDEPLINPYNFAPIAGEPVKRGSFPGWHRIGETACGGRLSCRLFVLSPLFTSGMRTASKKPNAETGTPLAFLRNSEGKAMIQGTTLKGMVRSVYEAITNSCLPQAATSGGSKKGREFVRYEYDRLGDHDRCSTSGKLCPACSLFGLTGGGGLHARGRLAFSDALLAEGELQRAEVLLPDLSPPKPHHNQIYSATGAAAGPIAGRKFYYHHDPAKSVGGGGTGSQRAKRLSEYAPAGTRFDFSVVCDNLSRGELAFLVRALVLDEGVGHKAGMAKPAGFGSCRIEVDVRGSAIYFGSGRYTAWDPHREAVDVDALKTETGPLPASLTEVLRLDKPSDGVIAYAPFSRYRSDNVVIDGKGQYPFPAPEVPPSPAPAPVTAPPPEMVEEEPAQAAEIAPPPPPPPSVEDVEKVKEPEKPPTRKVKQGDKVQVEVTAREGRALHLRIIDTGQEDFIFQSDYTPWKVGMRLRVRVAAVSADGQVKKINP